jgi:hypothetical protein
MGKLMSCLFVVLLSIQNAYGGDNPVTCPDNQEALLIDNKQGNLNSFIAQHNFVATGESTFSLLFWDLYKSKLMTTTGDYPISINDEKLIFCIEYLTDIKSKDLIERTIEQWQHIGLKESEYQKYVITLEAIWPNIKEGDSLALLMQKEKSVFYFNDKYLGTIDDPNFGQMFIDIWLSKNTSQPSLREELLGEQTNE